MKKRLWLALSVLSIMAVGVGTTFAIFSANVSTNSTFTSGSLCITSERNDGDPVPGPMFYVTSAQGQTPLGIPGTLPTDVWAPGDTHVRTLTIYNPASCSTMNAWIDTVQATMHPGGYLPMADKLWVELYTPQAGGPDVKIGEGWMSQFLAGPVPVSYPGGGRIPLYLSSNRHMKFRVHFDIGADNSYQDKTLVIDFTVNGSQMPNNP